MARKIDIAVEKARASERERLAEIAGLAVFGDLNVKELVMGHKIKAGKGAVVNVDSVVFNSFNKLEQRDAELKEALVELLAEVSKIEDPQVRGEAQELTTSMVEAAESDKKATFGAAWTRLREIAPVAGSMAGVAGVIARFLGVG